MTAALKNWHPGEREIQRKLGYADAVRDRWTAVENAMREQHRIFHTSNLPFIPVTSIDARGRPWASIVAGATGEIGFVKSPDARTLLVNARLWNGEPLLDTVKSGSEHTDGGHGNPEILLIAGLGIEFPTRRRNKFAGRIRSVKRSRNQDHLDYQFDLEVTQALGNCPKYINVRKLVPHPETNPSIVYQDLDLQPLSELPSEVIEFVTTADTVFLASVYNSDTSTADMFPSHAGMNARGGLPGFMRVSPSDRRTVVLPDYSGNRLMTSLGNIESSGLVGLTIVSFTTGDVLYLTGTAHVLVGLPALDIMPKQGCLTTIRPTGFTFVRDALPVRQAPGTNVEPSPYSPKIKYLREESDALGAGSGMHKARLSSAVQFADDLATFRFEVTSKPGAETLKIRPGQAIVLDFMDWIGPPQYQHMANDAPGSINDDRVRTWTVSSAHEHGDLSWFDLTMREMKGGAVTGALFNALREERSNIKNRYVSLYDQKIDSEIVGVTGDFFLGPGFVNALWIAGGVGITPFMAMLNALAERSSSQGDVVLALSTREPKAFLDLIKAPLRSLPNINVRLDLFTNQDTCIGHDPAWMNVHVFMHKGRIQPEYWKEVACGRDVFICGPGDFGDAAENGLRAAGVPNDKINREGFY